MKSISRFFLGLFIQLLIINCTLNIVNAQNTAITDDAAYSPNSSAMLDVKSITKGILIPRLTTTQRGAITTPATSLLVFDTTIGGFYYYNGASWINISTGTTSTPFWSYTSPNIYNTTLTDDVGIGVSAPLHKLHIRETNATIDGTDGAFIDIQNYSNTTGVLSGIRFGINSYNNIFKSGIFYKSSRTYNRGDLILTNNSTASNTNTTSNDARLVLENTGRVMVKGDPNSNLESAIFAVQNSDGDTIFAVYPQGVRINVYDDPLAKASSKKGGFAVGGFKPAKGTLTQEYFRVSPDSVRVYIEEGNINKAASKKGGFAVGGFKPAKGTTTDYFNIFGASAADILNPSEARIFWYPIKEALLSGRVLVESPDSVGTNSFASGFESKAVGNYSQALGYQCVARGEYSTSIGRENTSSGNGAFSLGYKCKSSAQTSTALGSFCTASGLNSMALGILTVSTGVASVALGMAANASGSNSLSMGIFSNSSGDNSIAFGSNSNASGTESVAVGSYADATGAGAICLGTGSATGSSAFSLGSGTTAQSFMSLVTGRYNVLSGTTTSWVETDPLFVVGNGASSAARSNAVTVLKNGNFGIGTSAPTNKLHVLDFASTVTDNSNGGYFSSTAGTTSGTAYGIKSYASAYGTSGSYAIYANATNGTTTGDEFAFYGVGNGYFSGNVGLGTTTPGSHKLYVTSAGTTTSGTTGYIVNTAAAGISLSIENSSTASSDAVFLASQKGSTGDIAVFDSWHGTGSWDREFRFTNTGDGRCDGSWVAGGADYAEYFPKADISKKYELGDVMIISSKGYSVETTNEKYSDVILGVYSSNPAVIGNSSAEKDPENSVLVGLLGVIPTKVCTENGEIKVGDFLTTSSTPGVAMKATKPGMIIGKALENYTEKSVGKIKVMVNPIWSGRNLE